MHPPTNAISVAALAILAPFLHVLAAPIRSTTDGFMMRDLALLDGEAMTAHRPLAPILPRESVSKLVTIPMSDDASEIAERSGGMTHCDGFFDLYRCNWANSNEYGDNPGITINPRDHMPAAYHTTEHFAGGWFGDIGTKAKRDGLEITKADTNNDKDAEITERKEDKPTPYIPLQISAYSGMPDAIPESYGGYEY